MGKRLAGRVSPASTVPRALGHSARAGAAAPRCFPPSIPDHQLLKIIGCGAYGEVWLGRSVLGKLRAIKVVRRHEFEDDRPCQREFEGLLKYEAISRSHPGLMQILHVGRNVVEGYLYYVMELADDAGCRLDTGSPADDAGVWTGRLEGQKEKAGSRNQEELYTPRTLRLDLRRRGRLPVAECLRTGLVLAGALRHLHEERLVHRDVKPSNIIFVAGEPKLADVGLVTRCDATVSCVGTEGYIPPEGPGSVRADIYAFGKTLYEAATGLDRRRFPELPPDVGEWVDHELLLKLNEVLIRACAVDAESRYHSTGELERELEQLEKGRSLHRLRLAAKVGRWARPAAAVVCAVAVLGLGILFWPRSTEPRPASTAVAPEPQTVRTAAPEPTELARLSYAVKMRLAQQAWEEDNIGRLRELLAETESFPDRGFEWFYWQRQLQLPAMNLPVNASVTAVAFSPDSHRLVTGDGAAMLWDLATGHKLRSIPAHGGRICALASDGHHLVTAGEDHVAKIWDLDTGNVRHVLAEHTQTISAASFSPDGQRVLTGSLDGTAKMWDVTTGGCLLTIRGEQIRAVGFSPDGQRFALGYHNEISLRETGTGQQLSFLTASTPQSLFSLAFSPDGRRIVAGFWNETALVWETDSSRELLALEGHVGAVWAVAWSPDGEHIITGGEDGTIKLWDASKGRLLRSLRGHTGAISSIAWSPDGRWIASGGTDVTVKVWKTFPDPAAVEIKLKANVRAARFSQDGKHLVMAGDDWHVRVWDVASATQLAMWRGHLDGIACLAISPDNQHFATCSFDQTAKVWHFDRDVPVVALPPQGSRVRAVAFSRDGRQFFTGDDGGMVRGWGIPDGQACIAFKADRNAIFSMDVSPDGARLVTIGMEGIVRFWDASAGQLLFEMNPHDGSTAVAYSPDGRRIAIATILRCGISITDVGARHELRLLRGHRDVITGFGFSPDGQRLATVSKDHRMKLWDVETGLELLTIKVPRALNSVAFSPEGRRIVAGSDTESAIIWEAASSSAERLVQ
ncbi:MAG: protein kinase family protein [Verrucomicrobiia bacterium]